MTEQFIPWDPADALDTPDAIVAFLASAFDTDDVEHIADAFDIVQRGKGMAALMQQTDLARERIGESLRAYGEPSPAAIRKALDALNHHAAIMLDAAR
jgi:probable addiction module antidote protein